MSEKYAFGVITAIPKKGRGNKCDELVELSDVRRDLLAEHIKLPKTGMIAYERDVFTLGEIIILPFERGKYGREVDGDQRKPSKWCVNMAVYDKIDDAARAAECILNDETSGIPQPLETLDQLDEAD